MADEKNATLSVARLALSDIKPHPKNPRKHPVEGSPAWETLKKSLAHDYFDPLVVNRRNGMLVSGHLRHKILTASGYTHADVSIVDYDEATHLARIVAANSLLGEWDDAALTALAGELNAAGLDVSLAGWGEDEFAALLTPPTVSDDSELAAELVSRADELQSAWRVADGDLFAIGAHRLLCGDCTVSGSWQKLLAGASADMVWTDPPYNVNYADCQQMRANVKTRAGKDSGEVPQEIINDNLSDADYQRLLTASLAAAFAHAKPGAAIYVAHADNHGLVTRQAFADAGWRLSQNLVWVKNAFTLGRCDYQWQHEPILYGWKPGAPHHWQGGFAQASVADDEDKNLSKLGKPELIAIINRLRNERNTDVIRESRNTGDIPHPTVKPVPLVARQIWNSSRRGETVLELFGGSGTTLIAAELTGRRCVATELDPKFCAVILQRAKEHGLTVEKINA